MRVEVGWTERRKAQHSGFGYDELQEFKHVGLRDAQPNLRIYRGSTTFIQMTIP